ncbi:hypothetical protein LCGC14_1580240 [marine sediment metagenome]|uniref:Sulfotransferase family protein n=1 Tax=marine sediment metagenome TaxID=412755 RepID=A0A0F9LH89_9ZZZZ
MDRRHKFIVSDKHHFIYYEIQKCATETMRQYFLGDKNHNSNPNKYGAIRISGGRSKGEMYNTLAYSQFTFVRNPWERVVSAWLSKFVFYFDPDHPDLPGIRDPELNLETTFDEFVRFIVKTSDKYSDCHFKSQHRFIPEENIEIGRVENLIEDFTRIRLKLGLPIDNVPYENVTPGKAKKHWREYYTDEYKHLVASRYAKDIELYGYTFE